VRFWICIILLCSLVGCLGQCKNSASHSDLAQVDQAQVEPVQVPKEGVSSSESVQSSAERRRLVFLGDSLTSGYGLPESESYPAKVQQLLSKEHSRWEVINAGVAGDTTQGGLERVDWVLRTKPDVVFLCLGANDGLRGIAPARTKENLLAIVRRIKSEQIPVLLAGMKMPANYGPERNAEYSALFKAVAKEEAIPFLPFLIEGVAMEREYNQPDGIHPNSRGSSLIADRVFTFVQPHLRDD
jgi:acyl-CoA thioesterase-1